MKVAYVTTYDAHDASQWSGTGHYIAKSLEQQGVELVYIGPLGDSSDARLAARRYWHRLVGRRRFLRERELRVSQGYARQIEEQLRDIDIDVILSPGTIPIAALSSRVPVAFWTDATFAQMVGLYPEFQNLARVSIDAGNKLEQLALDSASIAIYASEWAAKSAVADYGAASEKVGVIPFGANIPVGRDAGDVGATVDARGRDLCRLLFVGVDWQRKGGDIALAITAEIAALGVPVQLTVVGSTPEIPDHLRDLVVVRGYIDKSTAEGRRELDDLFATSHFLVMPSRAECFGIVFCEASSFGLPSIASEVGGIPSAVRDGRNGYLFPLSGIAQSAGRAVAGLWRDRPRYESLCATTFAEYQARLNWGAAGEECVRRLEQVIDAARSRPAAGSPRVTVITVVYNGAGHIEETVRGVAAQNYPNIEYIVVDGGSTDGTVAILQRLDDLIDRWVSEPDAGLYDAMNKAIAMVADPDSYIIFAHADDTLHSPDAIERAVALGRGADLVYGRMLFVDSETSAEMGRPVVLEDLARETLCHPATLVRRHVFDTVGPFDTSYRVAADYDHIVRCFSHPVSTRFADVVVTRMRMGGLSGHEYMISCRERKRVVRTYFSGLSRLRGVSQVNLYDIPRNTARHWLDRAGLLGHWRALKRS